MENDIQFLEEVVKRQIIIKFKAKVRAEDDQKISPLPFRNSILTMCDNDKLSKKFALTNVWVWNEGYLCSEVYNVSGIINDEGLIFITSYEIQA